MASDQFQSYEEEIHNLAPWGYREESLEAFDPSLEQGCFLYSDRDDAPTLKAHLRAYMLLRVKEVTVFPERKIRNTARHLPQNHQENRRRRL